MIVDGVNFIDDACLKMSKADFVKAHSDVFWLDKEKKERVKALSEAYDLMEKGKEK